ncbi:hypothetical protein GCM10023185_13230 [Hymenobacter saemangeumensis]|uniref:Uncharacterized protein n=1 Tax=Hymenobacter saemangeumensis TaxID=1084522 RepID=A0ABP8I7S7_9BACT
MSSPLTIVRQHGPTEWLATVDMLTGVLRVNGSRWDALKPAHRRFFELHELAHYQTKNADELLADRLAFATFIQERHPAREAYNALATVLNPAVPEHRLRLDFMKRRAARHTA